jgi:hypothetical protein
MIHKGLPWLQFDYQTMGELWHEARYAQAPFVDASLPTMKQNSLPKKNKAYWIGFASGKGLCIF